MTNDVTYGFVTRKDGTCSWEPVPLEERPYRSDPFGEEVRAARVAQYMTIGEMADRLGYSAVKVSRVERGVETISDEERRRWRALLEEAR